MGRKNLPENELLRVVRDYIPLTTRIMKSIYSRTNNGTDEKKVIAILGRLASRVIEVKKEIYVPSNTPRGEITQRYRVSFKEDEREVNTFFPFSFEVHFGKKFYIGEGCTVPACLVKQQKIMSNSNELVLRGYVERFEKFLNYQRNWEKLCNFTDEDLRIYTSNSRLNWKVPLIEGDEPNKRFSGRYVDLRNIGYAGIFGDEELADSILRRSLNKRCIYTKQTNGVFSVEELTTRINNLSADYISGIF